MSELAKLVSEQQATLGCQIAVAIVFPKLVELAVACDKRVKESPNTLTEIREILCALEALTDVKVRSDHTTEAVHSPVD